MNNNYQLHLGDCVQWAKDYRGEKYHALLTDPPYELGFMGRDWDASGVAFNPETWKSFLPILHDGAFGFAFASSRGWHRLAVAIEDAGFIIHPSIFGWVFGSGFPKATRTEKQEICKTCKGSGVIKIKVLRNDVLFEDYKYEDEICPECNGENEEGMFDGHRYGLQALKPAIEPIIVFQKPYKGSARENIKETGAGVLNIEGGRIGINDNDPNLRLNSPNHEFNKDDGFFGLHKEKGSRARQDLGFHNSQGRWPSNFYLDEEAARRLDEQSGELTSGARVIKDHKEYNASSYKFGGFHSKNVPSNSGGASRFFFIVRDQIDNSDSIRYVAKASKAERDAGLKHLPLQESGAPMNSRCATCGRLKLDHETSKCKCKKHIPMEQISKGSRNPHPTVKPISLTQYLATLLLPPAEYKPRRLFVPFSGVASEMIGAIQAGWDYVDGVEITEEYIPIAEARLKHWTKIKPKNMEMF